MQKNIDLADSRIQKRGEETAGEKKKGGLDFREFLSTDEREFKEKKAESETSL